jgi:hypothetical protein
LYNVLAPSRGCAKGQAYIFFGSPASVELSSSATLGSSSTSSSSLGSNSSPEIFLALVLASLRFLFRFVASAGWRRRGRPRFAVGTVGALPILVDREVTNNQIYSIEGLDYQSPIPEVHWYGKRRMRSGDMLQNKFGSISNLKANVPEYIKSYPPNCNNG